MTANASITCFFQLHCPRLHHVPTTLHSVSPVFHSCPRSLPYPCPLFLMASIQDFQALQSPGRFDPLLAYYDAATLHLLPVAAPRPVMNSGACEQFLFDNSPSTQRFFLPPDFSTAAAPEKFVAMASGSVNSQSSERPSWLYPGRSADVLMQPQCTFNAQVPSSRGMAEISGLLLDRTDHSDRPSAGKEDSRHLTARDSLRKQRVAKESLRRKKMSKWFSKLEVLLPQEDIAKFDRCSVIDAAIKYIGSLEKTIADAAESNNRQKLETTDLSTNKQTKASCSSARNLCSVVEEPGARQSVVAVSAHSENAFVNAVSCRRDPTQFSSVLSVLREHRLEVLTASLSRSEDTFVYCAHAKIPGEVNLCTDHLKDKIYDCITFSPRERSSEVKE